VAQGVIAAEELEQEVDQQHTEQEELSETEIAQ